MNRFYEVDSSDARSYAFQRPTLTDRVQAFVDAVLASVLGALR